jgi:hypothetical protein
VDGVRPFEGAYDAQSFIRALDGLSHQLGHRPATVTWENLGAHHGIELHVWAERRRGLWWSTCRRTHRTRAGADALGLGGQRRVSCLDLLRRSYLHRI